MTTKALIAICVGYGAGIWFSIQALRRRALLNRARQWLSVRGEIIESTTYRDPNRNATHFRIRYRFVIGETIEGSTPRVSGDWFWNDKQQTAFVARYVPGQQVEVFYDPRDPRQNCLDRTDTSGIVPMWVIAAGGTILASLLVWLQMH